MGFADSFAILMFSASQTLEETVACYCIVVRHITEDYGRVSSMLTSCVMKLQQYQNVWSSGKEPSAQEQKSIPFFIVISSLMVSSCDLDSAKTDKEGKYEWLKQDQRVLTTSSTSDVAAIIQKWCQASSTRHFIGSSLIRVHLIQGSVKQYVYELLLGLWEQSVDVGVRHAIIQGLSE